MDSIKDIIPRVIAPLSKGQANPSDIMADWKRLSGGGETSSVNSMKDGCLTIHVDCGARLMKMRMQEGEYLKDMQKNNPQIRAIKFKVGKI